MAEKSIIHICSDGYDNRPTAQELEQIKNKFAQFEPIIRMRSDSSEVKKLAYSAKYSLLLFAYAKERKLSDVKRMLCEGFSVDGIHFFYEVLRYGVNYIKQKVAR